MLELEVLPDFRLQLFYTAMVRRLSSLLLLMLLFMGVGDCFSQTIDHPLGDYHSRELDKQRRAIPFRPVREADVVWGSYIWRTIDLHEKFNQFFFYPTQMEGVNGRRNLAYVIWEAVKNSEIPIYEDDEFKIPLDNEAFLIRYMKSDTVQLEIIDDDDNYEYTTYVKAKSFYSEDVLQYRIKEAWYIDKQTTGQFSRILGLAMVQDEYKEVDGEDLFAGSIVLFWIPMQSMAVRNLLARNEAYYEDNIGSLPSWDEIFLSHNYSSFITRECNRFNRAISDYATGIDALIEADRIEDMLLELSSDMWDY